MPNSNIFLPTQTHWSTQDESTNGSKTLIQAHTFDGARDILKRVDVALSDLEAGRTKKPRYAAQKQEWYRYKHEQFT